MKIYHKGFLYADIDKFKNGKNDWEVVERDGFGNIRAVWRNMVFSIAVQAKRQHIAEIKQLLKGDL